MAIQKRKIRISEESEKQPSEPKNRPTKKILYLEIDDEVTSIYDKLNKLKFKNIYLVIPQRAVIFQSAINLKILKRKAEDLNKKIYIVTNDPSGFNLAQRVGLEVFDKLEGKEHPSLVSGKFAENNEITPLKASVNSLNNDSPSRRDEKKFSISEMVRKGAKGFQIIPKNLTLSKHSDIHSPKKKQEKDERKSSFVLIAPNKKALIGLVAVSAVILLIISYIALPGATLVLTPKSNVIEVPKNVVLADVERNRAELDTRPNNMIGTAKKTVKFDKVFTFQATGKNAEGGKNATGKIKVKNVSSNDWPLVPKTRFQTADGIVFRSTNQVIVPAGTQDKPGELEISVLSDALDSFNKPIGERGNLPMDTKFFLPALIAENQKKLFAVSSSVFAGGVTNVTKFISKEDVDAARAKMDTELRASAESELKSEVQKQGDSQKVRLALLSGKGLIETSDPIINIPPNIEGQKLDSFDVKGSIIASGIVYNLDELLSVLKREIQLKKNPEKSLASVDEDALTYKLVNYDKNAGKVTITATIQGIEEFEVSPKKENGDRLIKKIKESIVGKNIREARDFVQNLPEIEKAEITTWPAWAPTIPSVPDNIKVEIKH